MADMTKNERWLLDAAREARRWFDNRTRGNALNGPQDDIGIGRALTAAIRAVEAEQEASAAALRETVKV